MAEPTDDIVAGTEVSPSPPTPAPKQVSFDVAAARKVGYSEGAIAAFLATKTDFDYTRAKESGYSDKQIINQLAPPAGPPKPTPEKVPESPSGWGLGVVKAAKQAAITDLVAAPKIGVGSFVKSAGQSEARESRLDVILMQRFDEGEDFRALMKDAPNDLARLALRQYQIATPEQKTKIRQDAINAAASPPGAVERGGENILQAGHDLATYAKKNYPLTEEEEQRPEVMATKMLVGLTGYIGAGLTAGLPGVMGYGGLVSFGQTYDEAKAKGASDDVASGAGLLSGVTQGSMMAVPIGESMKLFQMVPVALRGKVMSALAETAKSGAVLLGFTQASKIADNVVAQNTYDPNRPTLQGVGDPKEMAITAGVGALLPVPGIVANRLRPKAPSARDIIDAPDVDTAIAKAREVVESAPVDVEGMVRDAQEFGGREDQQQASVLKLFRGMNEGTVEQAPDGNYQYRVGEQTFPLKVWDETVPVPKPIEGEPVPAPTIAPALAAAQREAYGKMGIDVVFIDDAGRPSRFDGAVDPSQPNTIFLSNQPDRNASMVGAHEVGHLLEDVKLPDAKSVGDVIHDIIARDLTPEGLRHAYETFGKEAPARAAFPEGPAGSAAHVDAVWAHLIRELGADVAGEAPKFQTFIPRVIDEVQARYGAEATKGVLQKLISGFKEAMDRLRSFFFKPAEGAEYGQPDTVSQHRVANIGEIHAALAKAYAERFGTQVEKENAALAAMRDRAQRSQAAAAQNVSRETLSAPSAVPATPQAAPPVAVPQSAPPPAAIPPRAPVAVPAARPEIPATPFRDDHAVLPSGEQVPVTYAIVSARDLIASQRADFAANPDYPAELQPRDRTRSASAVQVHGIAENLNPRLLDNSVHASDGAPIIGKDGVVESGNGRVLAITRAYSQGLPSAEQYSAYLKEQGYPVEGIEHPVLVRVRHQDISPTERAAFAREANQRSTMDMSATEQAKGDAAALSGDVLLLHRGGDIASAGNRDFVRAFIRDAVGPNDRAGMMTAAGILSSQGRRRIENALISKAYGDEGIVAALVENPDTNIKALGRALTETAPAWSAMREEAAAGKINPAVDITRDLVDAVNIVRQARDAGRNIAEFVGQKDMFGGTIAPETEAFLRIMFRGEDFTGPRSAEKVIDALGKYVQQARETTAGPGLFGAQDVVSPRGILDVVRSRQARDEGTTALGLFDRPSGPAADSGVGAGQRGDDGQRPIGGEGGPEAGPDRPALSPRVERVYTPEQQAADKAFATDKPLMERLRGSTTNLPERTIIQTLDRFYGIKADDPAGYMGLRLSNSAAGATEAFMTEATLKFDGRTYDWKERTGGVEALVKGLGSEARDFAKWIAGHRAEQLKAEGRENLLDDTQIRGLKSLNQGKLSEPYTLADGKQTLSREAAYMDALKKYHALNVNVMDLAVESGLITRDAADKLLGNRFYIPFYRVDPREGEQFVAPGSSTASVKQTAFKKLKGGTEQLNDLWENATSNWSHLIESALKNKNTIPVLQTAVKQGAAVKLTSQEALHLSDKVQKATTVWVMENGEKQYYRIEDKGLFAAVSVLEPVVNVPFFSPLARGAKRLLQTGVTMNPAFALRNIIRDTQQVLATTPISWNVINNLYTGFKENNAGRAIENLGRAIAGQELKATGMSDTALSALAGGALMRFGDVADAGIRQTKLGTQSKIFGVLNTPEAVQGFWEGLRTAAGAYREAMGQSEDVTRIALFKQLKEQGLPQDFAAFSAKDIADFTLSGASQLVRTLNSMSAFTNARMQGLYKVGRATADADGNVAAAIGTRVGVGIAKRVATVVLAGALLDIGLDAIYANDEDWKKRDEFDKNSNYWFKIGKTQFWIPKGFEVGAVSRLGAIFTESFYDKEMTVGRVAENVWSILWNNLNLNPTPTILKPLWDIGTNTSAASGNPIVPRGLDRLQPEQRYTINNTLQARGISSVMNSAMRGAGIPLDGLSPIQVDYLARAYGGWLATTSMQMGDAVARSFTSEPTKPAGDSLAYWTGGLVSNEGRSSSRYVNMLYEQGGAIEKAYATYKDLLERGQALEARQFFEANKEAISKHGLVSSVMRTEGEINKQIRIVTNNPDPRVTAEQKHIQIMQLQNAKNRLAESAFGVR